MFAPLVSPSHECKEYLCRWTTKGSALVILHALYRQPVKKAKGQYSIFLLPCNSPDRSSLHLAIWVISFSLSSHSRLEPRDNYPEDHVKVDPGPLAVRPPSNYLERKTEGSVSQYGATHGCLRILVFSFLLLVLF